MVALYHEPILIRLSTRAIDFLIAGIGWVFDLGIFHPMADPKWECPISTQFYHIMVQNHESVPNLYPVEIGRQLVSYDPWAFPDGP